MSKGSIWYNPELDMIAIQTSYEPIINTLEYDEPRLTKHGIFRFTILLHNFELFGWEWICQL